MSPPPWCCHRRTRRLERVQQQPPDAAALEAVGDGDRDLDGAGLAPDLERVVDAVVQFVAPAR